MLCACGYIGPPLPPTLDIPVTITDFRAWESGENIELMLTLPDKTTENLPLTSVRSVELRIGESMIDLPVGKTGTVITAQVPVQMWLGKTVVMAVRATGPKGKASAWSNPASLAVIQPLATPSSLNAQNVKRGVELTWTGVALPGAPRYRIFRAEADGQPQPLADSDGPHYLDETTIYGTRYRYLVQAIASDKQWSVVSAPAEITPEDKFPPAVPEGLSAVPTPQTIELAWTRNTEPDFRGYNIFRSVDNTPFEKIAAMIGDPTFSDSKIEPGKKYRYTLSAVDLTGNESDRSAPAEATAQ